MNKIYSKGGIREAAKKKEAAKKSSSLNDRVIKA